MESFTYALLFGGSGSHDFPATLKTNGQETVSGYRHGKNHPRDLRHLA